MRSRLKFRWCIGFLVSLSWPASVVADHDAALQSVLQSQSARFQAMIDEDIDRLEGYLAEDLTYSHNTGWIETKAEFLSTVESKVIDYVAVEPRDVKVRIYDDVAVLTGLSDMHGVARGEPVQLTIRFLEVSRRVADTWKLVAWQSVRYTAE